MDGAIVVNKPSGWTSHDVVNRIRRLAGTKKVGHLGTLDPMATGVLPLLLNRATRLAQFFSASEKVYEASIHFGYATSTYDVEGEPLGPEIPYTVEIAELERLLEPMRGTFLQLPPAVSAKKVGGIPAYKLARKNIAVELEPVEVTIHSAEVLSADGPDVSLRVRCSAGTYVRSLAHDLGRAAGPGAHLRSLVRLQSGEFTIDQARTLEDLEQLAANDAFATAVIPAAQLLADLPTERVDALTAGQIRQGRSFRSSPFRAGGPAGLVKAVAPDGLLVAIGKHQVANLYHPMVVL